MKNEAFTPAGVYHKRYEAYSKNPLHGAKLRFFYKEAQDLVSNLGWENTLAKSNPRLLLCGTGSHQTSKAFLEFVHDQNPQVSVSVIDLNAYPLTESKKGAFIESSFYSGKCIAVAICI